MFFFTFFFPNNFWSSLVNMQAKGEHSHHVAEGICSEVLQVGGGDVAQLVEHRTGTPPTQVRFLGAARDFSPWVNFQCRLFYGVRPLPCAVACIYICAHVKDPVVHVRVRWIMEALKHPACTLGGVARLCCSWLSPEKAARISHGTVQL